MPLSFIPESICVKVIPIVNDQEKFSCSSLVLFILQSAVTTCRRSSWPIVTSAPTQVISHQFAKFNPAVYNWPIVSLCVCLEDYTKNERGVTYHEQDERMERVMTHIVCDFLSQVRLCDEDLGDFLTGSVKHTSHQRVFTVPQPSPLCKVTDQRKQMITNSQAHKHTEKQHFCHNNCKNHDLPPDSCTI